MSRTRRCVVHLDTTQHDLTMVDLRNLARWLESLDANPKKANGRPALRHHRDTVAARLADLADRLSAYEETDT